MFRLRNSLNYVGLHFKQHHYRRMAKYSVFNNIVKSPEDKREYRGLQLENGMNCLLISDPLTDKSAASLCVRVGSLSDPPNIAGLAHFCEHMLFLGTEKYPEENAYGKYIHDHGGSTNAYTALEQTNYHFDVLPDHFPGALDRFAQFFITPLFTESATQREINAVDSEHSKNLQSDGWRMVQLDRSLSDPKHDYSKFATGSRETLDTIPRRDGVDVRRALLDFHQRYYSANVMRLAILDKSPLDSLEQSVVSLFSSVPNRNAPILRWDKSPLHGEHLKIAIKLQPVKDIRQVQITFPIEDQRDLWKSKPAEYLSHLIGHEGPCSLLSALKKRGWVNTLSAGPHEGATGFAFFHIGTDLSEAGLEHIEEIVQLTFDYLAMLRRAGAQRWIFDEMKTLNNMKFRFRDKQNPISYVTTITESMQDYPIEHTLDGSWVLEDFEPKLIDCVLEKLTPENCRITLLSKSFKPHDASDAAKEGSLGACDTKNVVLDKTERWYGTRYAVHPFSEQLLSKWRAAKDNEELRLPAPNEFLPSNFDLLKRESDAAALPQLLADDKFLRVWYKQDEKFLLPKACVYFELFTPLAFESPHAVNSVYMLLELFKDYLNEFTYDAYLGGLSYSADVTLTGISLRVRGYNEKQRVLLEKLLDSLFTFEIREDRFSILREVFERQLRNHEAETSYQHALYYASYLLAERQWTVAEKLAVFERLTLDAVRNAQKVLLRNTFVEAFVYGNVTREAAHDIVKLTARKLKQHAQSTPLLPSQLAALKCREVMLDANTYYSYTHINKVQPVHAVDFYLQLGTESMESVARLELLVHASSEQCFNQLRTKEQLGYIVHLGMRRSRGAHGLHVLVQSAFDPNHVERRIEVFLRSTRRRLAGLSDAEFAKLRDALAEEKRVKPKQLAKQADSYYAEIMRESYEFDLADREADAISQLTKQDLLDFFDKYIALGAPQRRKLVTHIRSANPQSNNASAAGDADADAEEANEDAEDGAEKTASEKAEETKATAEDEQVELGTPVVIKDVALFKNQHALCAFPRPIKSLPFRGYGSVPLAVDADS